MKKINLKQPTAEQVEKAVAKSAKLVKAWTQANPIQYKAFYDPPTQPNFDNPTTFTRGTHNESS